MNCFLKNIKKIASEKTKKCRVKYEERFYGKNRKNFIIQEFFNFHSYEGNMVMNRWFPQTIKQFASFELYLPDLNPFEIILYKNGFFDINSQISVDYKGRHHGWNQNIESFFILDSWKNPLSGIMKYSRNTKIMLFKKDETCLQLIFHDSYPQEATILSPYADETFFTRHNLSPSFFFVAKNNQIFDGPMFQLFEETTTSTTKKCTITPEIEINKKLNMSITKFFDKYVKNCPPVYSYKFY